MKPVDVVVVDVEFGRAWDGCCMLGCGSPASCECGLPPLGICSVDIESCWWGPASDQELLQGLRGHRCN